MTHWRTRILIESTFLPLAYFLPSDGGCDFAPEEGYMYFECEYMEGYPSCLVHDLRARYEESTSLAINEAQYVMCDVM